MPPSPTEGVDAGPALADIAASSTRRTTTPLYRRPTSAQEKDAVSDMSPIVAPLYAALPTRESRDNRRAVERGSLPGVAVADLPGPPPLDDALLICLLLLDQEPDRYERAAVRWLGRLLLEQRGASLRHAELAAAYLAAWPDAASRDAASDELGELGRVVGLRRLGARIARLGGG